MDVILNFLRLTEAEREAFRSAAPTAEHLFRPVEDQTKRPPPPRPRSSPGLPSSSATPPPPRWRGAKI